MKTPFYFIMFKAFHAQRKQIRKNMDKFNLSPGQPKVLMYIATHNDCMLKDIANHCDVEPATVSKLLNALEDNGMLVREVVENNKRALRLSITKKGKKALKQWDVHCHEVEQIALNHFSEEEKAKFEEYLCRMYHNLSGKELE